VSFSFIALAHQLFEREARRGTCFATPARCHAKAAVSATFWFVHYLPQKGVNEYITQPSHPTNFIVYLKESSLKTGKYQK
jgi:hypothetical protein